MAASAKPYGIVTHSGEFVRQNVLEEYAIKSDTVSRQLVDEFSKQYTKYNLIEPSFNPYKIANLLLLNTYHARCVNTIAKDVAGSGFEINKEESTKQSDYDLLLEFFTRNIKVFEAVDKDIRAIGFGYIEIVKELYAIDGEVLFLNHLPAATVRRHKDYDNQGRPKKFAQIKNGKTIWFKAAGLDQDINYKDGSLQPSGTVPVNQRGSEIWFFNDYSPNDLFYNTPTILPAIQAIKGDISRARYNATFFDNYAVPAYAIFITGNFPSEDDDEFESDEEQEITDEDQDMDDFDRQIEKHFKDLNKNPHSTLVLKIPANDEIDGGKVEVQAIPLSTDVKEASFRLYRQDNMKEIIICHGVPGYRIGVTDTGALAGNIAIEATKIYANSVVAPDQNMFHDFINTYLIKQCFLIENCTFKFNPVDIDTLIQDVDLLVKLFGVGAATPNDIIRFLPERFNIGESDHPAMDAHYIGGNAIDLEINVQDPNQSQNVVDELVIKLLGVAEKHVSAEDGEGTAELLEVIKSLKGSTSLGNSS